MLEEFICTELACLKLCIYCIYLENCEIYPLFTNRPRFMAKTKSPIDSKVILPYTSLLCYVFVLNNETLYNTYQSCNVAMDMLDGVIVPLIPKVVTLHGGVLPLIILHEGGLILFI